MIPPQVCDKIFKEQFIAFREEEAREVRGDSAWENNAGSRGGGFSMGEKWPLYFDAISVCAISSYVLSRVYTDSDAVSIPPAGSRRRFGRRPCISLGSAPKVVVVAAWGAAVGS